MFNLIKKDFIVSIKGEGKGILKYLFMFLFTYFFMNSVSYFLMPIFISYLILANTFYNDYKNKNMNFINSMPTSKEDIVYSKYILALIIIISITTISSLINNVFSSLFYREVVLNDVYFSIILFLIIVSITMPLYFKYKYHKVRTVAGIISVIVFITCYILIEHIAMREYYVKHPNMGYSVSAFGPFKNIIEYIAIKMDVTYINIQNITIVSIFIFIISMYVSLKIIKKEHKIKGVS